MSKIKVQFVNKPNMEKATQALINLHDKTPHITPKNQASKNA
ncbi:hypothetical protein ABVK62_09055 [Bacillus subtilis]